MARITYKRLRQGGKRLGGSQWEPHGLAISSGEIRALALNPSVLPDVSP